MGSMVLWIQKQLHPLHPSLQVSHLSAHTHPGPLFLFAPPRSVHRQYALRLVALLRLTELSVKDRGVARLSSRLAHLWLRPPVLPVDVSPAIVMGDPQTFLMCDYTMGSPENVRAGIGFHSSAEILISLTYLTSPADGQRLPCQIFSSLRGPQCQTCPSKKGSIYCVRSIACMGTARVHFHCIPGIHIPPNCP